MVGDDRPSNGPEEASYGEQGGGIQGERGVGDHDMLRRWRGLNVND